MLEQTCYLGIKLRTTQFRKGTSYLLLKIVVFSYVLITDLVVRLIALIDLHNK
jgi:hypothetical protein